MFFKSELEPTKNGQKSFYGKAILESLDGIVYLRSYGTRVCSIEHSGKFHKIWNGYSATTMRHINAFRDCYNMSKLTKAEWDALS